MILVLTRGDSPIRIPLRFPISPAEEGEVFARLDMISTDVRSTRIVEVHSAIPNFGKYLKSANIVDDDYGKIKRLDMLLDNMTEQEQWIFSGALDAESINGMDDILRVAEHLDDYELVGDVTTDRELGEWLVENNMMEVEFPQAVRPYLDYVAIGAEYYSNHGGAYTLNGYVKHREAAQELAADMNSVFTLHLTAHDRAKQTDLSFPATEEMLDTVKHRLEITEFCEAKITGLECSIPYMAEAIPIECASVEDANDLASAIAEMQHTDGELLKYLSALSVEKPSIFQEALEIAYYINDYERVPDNKEEYGKEVLRRIGADDEVIDSIEGYMNFKCFGEDMMAEDGVRQTEFGLVRRLSEPFPSPQQGQNFQ